MNSLANHVKDNFKGMLVFGDVHSDFASYIKASKYADVNGLFFMSLGDLVDRGNQPFEVVQAHSARVANGTGGFTVGNHDNKFYRYANGANVQFSRDGKGTLAHVGEDRMQEFLRMYCEMIETPTLSGIYHKFGDMLLVHAASHPEMWESGVIGKTAQSRALVGETTGKIADDGYPERLYNWVDEVPMGKLVVVGHDRMPYDKLLLEPLHKTNANGGKVIFMDTGCGKGGFLTGAVVVPIKSGFKIEQYVEFK